MTGDMKRHVSLLALLFALVLNVRSVQGQKLTVQNESGKQIALSRSDIEGLPHVQATAGTPSDPITYEGVTLKSALEKAGVSFGESLKGKRLGFCLMVQAADGYRVVIALPELDPAFTDKRILLVFLRNGKLLDEKEGPYRVVIPDEKKMARWTKQVTLLKIVDVP
jgi:Oxidoreductase molybdopterin binding domain